MNHILEDIKKFRELLNKTPAQLNEMFSYDQKKGGQTVPPQDKLGHRPEQGIAKNPEDYKDMMTDPKMDHVKKAYAAGGPKGQLPEDENLDEAQKVEIIGYDSGTGPQLAQAAKDPKHRREVNVVSITIGSRGQPVLKFNEMDGSGPFMAEWDPQYGWHADFS